MFIILELQINSDGSVGSLVNKRDTRDEADSVYHSILAAASVSNIPVHSAVLLTADGRFVASETHRHDDTAPVEE